MGLFRKITYSFLLFLLVSLFGLSPTFAVTGEHPVLIISSYNPDARQTSGNIYDFMEEFERLGGKALVLTNLHDSSSLWKHCISAVLPYEFYYAYFSPDFHFYAKGRGFFG